MYSSAYVWAKVLSHMEERLGAVTVSAWFDDAEVVELNENNLILYSPSDFRREIIRRRCTDYIQDALKEVFNSDAKLMVFGDEELDAFKQKGKSVSSMDFNPQFTFDNFVVGPSNRFALWPSRRGQNPLAVCHRQRHPQGKSQRQHRLHQGRPIYQRADRRHSERQKY